MPLVLDEISLDENGEKKIFDVKENNDFEEPNDSFSAISVSYFVNKHLYSISEY